MQPLRIKNYEENCNLFEANLLSCLNNFIFLPAEIEGIADRVEFKKADVRDIPYPDNCFDIVVASFVLHMIYKNREVAFKEMIRVLKPGGKFAIIEPPGGYRWRIN